MLPMASLFKDWSTMCQTSHQSAHYSPHITVSYMPLQFLECYSGKQIHPAAATAIDKQLLSASNDGVFLPVQKVDFGWLLCRMNIAEESILFPVPRSAGIQTVPACTGFNAQLQYDTVPTLSSIGYIPVIEAKAMKIIFQRPIEFKNIVLCLGVMHTQLAYLAILGNTWFLLLTGRIKCYCFRLPFRNFGRMSLEACN